MRKWYQTIERSEVDEMERRDVLISVTSLILLDSLSFLKIAFYCSERIQHPCI